MHIVYYTCPTWKTQLTFSFILFRSMLQIGMDHIHMCSQRSLIYLIHGSTSKHPTWSSHRISHGSFRIQLSSIPQFLPHFKNAMKRLFLAVLDLDCTAAFHAVTTSEGIPNSPSGSFEVNCLPTWVMIVFHIYIYISILALQTSRFIKCSTWTD